MLSMPLVNRTGQCRTLRLSAVRLQTIHDEIGTDNRLTAAVMATHDLATATEARALMILETYHRRHRAVPVDSQIIAAALDRIIREAGHPFPPNRANLQRLNSLARVVVTNTVPPREAKWLKEDVPLGVA